MKLGQNFCLDKISDEYENGSWRVKVRSLGQILEKPVPMLSRPDFRSDTHETWSECLPR